MLTWEGSWPNSLVWRPPWLHACSVKNKQTKNFYIMTLSVQLEQMSLSVEVKQLNVWHEKKANLFSLLMINWIMIPFTNVNLRLLKWGVICHKYVLPIIVYDWNQVSVSGTETNVLERWSKTIERLTRKKANLFSLPIINWIMIPFTNVNLQLLQWRVFCHK